MEKRQALLYGFEEDVKAICDVLLAMDIAPTAVGREQGGEKIGFLCGMPGYEPGKTPEITGKPAGAIIVFAGLDLPGGELTRVLQNLRQAGLAAGALKGVVTDTNADWPVDDVLQEYLQEKKTVEALMELEKLRRRIPMPEPSNVPLIMALMQAESLLSGSRTVELEEVQKVHRLLQNAAGE